MSANILSQKNVNVNKDKEQTHADLRDYVLTLMRDARDEGKLTVAEFERGAANVTHDVACCGDTRALFGYLATLANQLEVILGLAYNESRTRIGMEA